MDVDIIKVSARSRTASVAGAVAGVMREVGRAEVQAIGAGAVNQAIKAIAIARGYLTDEGHDIVCVPSFVDIMIDGSERTALRILVLPRIGHALETDETIPPKVEADDTAPTSE